MLFRSVVAPSSLAAACVEALRTLLLDLAFLVEAGFLSAAVASGVAATETAPNATVISEMRPMRRKIEKTDRDMIRSPAREMAQV